MIERIVLVGCIDAVNPFDRPYTCEMCFCSDGKNCEYAYDGIATIIKIYNQVEVA